MDNLTFRQRKVYEYICKFYLELGIPPSIKDITLEYGFKSPTAAQTHLIALEKKGYIKKYKDTARSCVPIAILKKLQAMEIKNE